MRYASLKEKTACPQFLQIQAQGRLYDIVLHKGLGDKIIQLKSEFGYGINQRRRAYCVWLFTSGKGSFHLDKNIHPFRRGTLVLTDPGQPHPEVNECPGGFSISFLGFSMISRNGLSLECPMNELLSLMSGERLSSVMSPVQMDAKLARLIERLMEDYDAMFIPGERVRLFPAHRILMEILFLLVENVYEPEAGVDGFSDSPLVRVRMEIEKSYDKTLSLSKLAKLASLSPPYLCRAFRSAFGVTPIAYQQELRLRDAKTLLTTSEMRVGEIAYAVGFQSVYHFSRLFRKRSGCTPTDYREKQ